MTTGCLTASTRGYMLTIDQRCCPELVNGRLMIQSDDAVGLRIELAESDVMTAEPTAAEWSIYDVETGDLVSAVEPITPVSDDMAFVVYGLVNDTEQAVRKMRIQVRIEFGEASIQKTVTLDVGVRKVFEPLAEVRFRLSGGASNTVAAASLGGAKSSATVGSGLFGAPPPSPSAVSIYRCIYLHNGRASPLQAATVWIASNSPSAETQLAIGMGTSAVNGTEQTVVDENTAPAGVTFTEPTEGSPLTAGAIPAGQHKALWLRLSINAGATIAAGDGATVRVGGMF
jgi:hypothetical protein